MTLSRSRGQLLREHRDADRFVELPVLILDSQLDHAGVHGRVCSPGRVRYAGRCAAYARMASRTYSTYPG